MYSKQELNGDSSYIDYAALIRGMRIARPSWHFVVIFPDLKSGFKYEEDGFFKSSNVSRVLQRISPRKKANAVAYDAAWYDALFRQYAFDAILCNLVEITGHLKAAGHGSSEMRARPLAVAAHHYVIHKTLPYTFEAQENIAIAQTMGAIAADWNVFNSEHCKEMFVETASEWLNQKAIDSILGRSSKISNGTLEQSIRFDGNRDENKIPIIAYNHRLQGYKNWTTTFEIFKELYEEGLKFRVRFTSNTLEHTSQIAAYPFVEIALCSNRKVYLEALSTCDLNVTNSGHETFCNSAVESMAFGQPLVAPDGVTFPEITNRDKLKYPYLFSSPKQQKAMIRKLVLDASERRKWGARLSEYVRGEYNQILWAERYARLFEGHLEPIEMNPKEDTYQFFKERLSICNGKRLMDFYNDLVRKEVNGRIPFSSQSLSMTKLLRLIRQAGGSIAMIGGSQCVYAPGVKPPLSPLRLGGQGQHRSALLGGLEPKALSNP